MVRALLGVAALAAALAGAAQAQTYHVTAYDDAGSDSSEVSALKAEVSELREKLNSATHAGYESAPASACGGCESSGGHCGSCGGCDACCGDCCGYDCCNTCCQQYCCEQGTCGCFEPCCHSAGVWASVEWLFFRYHRADGVRVGVDANEGVEFDFESTLRLTAGVVRDDGVGVRIRWWEFDHTQPAFEGGGSAMRVNTYTFDFELFDTFCLNRNWDLEIAGGVRCCEFEETMQDIPGDAETRFNYFTGFGVLGGAELRRVIGQQGNVWLRARSAILMDDKDVFNTSGAQQERLLDVTVGMTELAFGYDFVAPLQNGAYAFAGVQAEWQNWYNFSSGFEDTANNEDFAGPSDVGFGGFGIRVGIGR
jgi:hypothetical protein